MKLTKKWFPECQVFIRKSLEYLICITLFINVSQVYGTSTLYTPSDFSAVRKKVTEPTPVMVIPSDVSGSALKCFNCTSSPCKSNMTCPADKDACIVAYLGGRNVSDCWKYSLCNLDYVGKYFNVDSFRFVCCQRDLCNGSSIPVASKIVLAIAASLTIIKLVSF